MDKLKRILIEHKYAIAIALFASIVVALPQVYFRIDQGPVYQGIELLPSSPWLPRVREVQDGHLNWGSIYYKDGKDLPYLFQPLGSVTVAYMGMALGLDINNTMLLFRILMPFIVFLLIYYFVLLLSRSKLVSLASSAVIVLAEPIIYIPGLKRLLMGISPSQFLEIARPVNSAMISFYFFAFLVAFWLYLRNKDWRWGIASAILLGANFYNYVYTWTYLYAFLAIFGLVFVIEKNWEEFKRVFYVFVGGFIVAIPYIINLYQAMQHPNYDAVGVRGGLLVSHAPMFIGSIALGALILYMLGFPKEDKGKYHFGLALLLAPMVTMNQQILTGHAMQSAHYHWYFHKPIAIVFSIWVIFLLLGRLGKDYYKKVFIILILVVSLYAGAFTQVASYFQDEDHGLEFAIESQKYGPVMDWLNENVEKETMVFSNEDTAEVVVIYTSLNVFHHVKAHLSLAASDDRMREVLFTYYRLQGVDRNNARELFHGDERVFISTRIYGIYYRQALGSYEAIPDDLIDDFTDLYLYTLKTPRSEWLKSTWQKYEVEYLVWDKVVDPDWNLDRIGFLKKEAEFGDLEIYSTGQ